MKALWPSLLAGSLLLPQFAFADVSYQETTQITGGSMVGMMKMAGAFSAQAKQLGAPITSNVMIHGAQMVHADPHTTSIIDLDQQTITNIDHDKRTYSVVTFQQMQQAMADAAAKMKGSQPASSGPSQLSFNAHFSTSGATRELEGQTAKESLLTLTMIANTTDPNAKGGMAATTEMWLVKDVPGMAEMRRFNERLAKELVVDTTRSAMNSLLASQPGGAQALDELKKESVKVSGFPILQVTRVGLSVDGQPLAAPSVAPLPASQAQSGQGGVAGDVTKDVAKGTATQEAYSQMSKLGTFGRALGGSSMGALMKHSSGSPTPAPGQAANTNPATAGVLLESQNESSGFSVAPVTTSSFQVPAGYKQVTSPMVHK